jgi:hypothetical protein
LFSKHHNVFQNIASDIETNSMRVSMQKLICTLPIVKTASLSEQYGNEAIFITRKRADVHVILSRNASNSFFATADAGALEGRPSRGALRRGNSKVDARSAAGCRPWQWGKRHAPRAGPNDIFFARQTPRGRVPLPRIALRSSPGDDIALFAAPEFSSDRNYYWPDLGRTDLVLANWGIE